MGTDREDRAASKVAGELDAATAPVRQPGEQVVAWFYGFYPGFNGKRSRARVAPVPNGTTGHKNAAFVLTDRSLIAIGLGGFSTRKLGEVLFHVPRSRFVRAQYLDEGYKVLGFLVQYAALQRSDGALFSFEILNAYRPSFEEFAKALVS